jgi:hypothetical protein
VKPEPAKPAVKAPAVKPEPAKPAVKAPAIVPAQPAQVPLKAPAAKPPTQPVDAKAQTVVPSPTPAPATTGEPPKNQLNRAPDSKKAEPAATNKANLPQPQLNRESDRPKADPSDTTDTSNTAATPDLPDIKLNRESDSKKADKPRLPRLKLKLSPQSMVDPYPLSAAIAVTSPTDSGKPVEPNSVQLKSLLVPEPKKTQIHIPSSFKQILDSLPMPQSAKSINKGDATPVPAPSPGSKPSP